MKTLWNNFTQSKTFAFIKEANKFFYFAGGIYIFYLIYASFIAT